MPKVKSQVHLDNTCVFEPSIRLKAVYTGCTTYEGIVTIDDDIFQSGIFNVVMTNTSMKHVKINNNQTMGMLRTCKDDKIFAIHKKVSFDKVPVKGEGDKTVEKQVGTDLYHIPIRNERTGKIEVNTLLKRGEYFPVINEIGSQQDFVINKKPELQDAPIDKQIKTALEKLLEANQDSFAGDERQIGTTPLIKMSIDSGNHPSIAKKPYTLAIECHEWVKEEIDKLLEADVIRESHSGWSAPVVVVPKGDGGKRMCIDYRTVNAISRIYIWLKPRIDDILAKLGKAKFLTTLDLRSGYHLDLDKDAIMKTAFVTPFGKYECLKVPFGLAQAPSYFQNLMNKVLNGLNFRLAYLDDIFIFSQNAEQHLKQTQIVLNRLRQVKMKLRKSKCAFFMKELHYLGHLLTTDSVKPQPEKIKAISEMKSPKNQKGVREFLGMVGYYRKFISRFADAARPMTKFTRKDSKFEWSDDCQTGFEYLKTCLAEDPLLKYPNPHKRYTVFTDVSDQAAAAVLTQEYSDENGEVKEIPISHLSAQFPDTQFKWSTIVKESYAIYYAIKKWRCYLDDADILLKSDAKSLEKFLHGRTDSHKLDRWSLELQVRNIKVEHIPGHKNKAADCLSRLPFVTRKRNSNLLKDEVSLRIINECDKPTDICCSLCEINLTNTKELQQSDKHCIRIAKLMPDPKSRFNERDSYGYDDSGLLYHLKRENSEEFKAIVVPKSLIKAVLQEIHDHFGHFELERLIHL